MLFNISIRKIILFVFLGFSLIGIGGIFVGIYFLTKGILPGLIVALLSLIIYSLFGRCLFFHNIHMYQEYMVLDFGISYFKKKIYYKDIAKFRYAIKNDYILQGQPALGKLSETVALTFTNGEMLFISIKNVSTFYQRLLELNCIEEYQYN